MGINDKGYSRIRAAQMRFLRAVKGCTRLNYFHNEDIMKVLDVELTANKLLKYGGNWTFGITGMLVKTVSMQITM